VATLKIKLDDTDIDLIDAPEGFEDRLRSVWQQIPADARRDIVSCWTYQGKGGQSWPNIISIVNEGEEGCTRQGGRTIQFTRQAIEKDHRYVDCLVAHELAHVHDWEVGPASRSENPKFEPPEFELAMERYAVRLASSWGFPLPNGRSPEDHDRIYAQRLGLNCE
jgi:hypothetical protein